MRTPAQKILSLFLAMLMLAFTVGVSVYEHYCFCTNKRTASVFVEVACADDQEQSCCTARLVEESTCCSEYPSISCHHEPSCNADNCCKTEQDIIQIESKYQVSQVETIKSDLIPVKVIAVFTANPKPQINSFTEGYYIDASPPVFSRQFLIAVHQLKLDIPVC